LLKSAYYIWIRQEYVIIGHSERRQYFGETGEITNKKIKAALKAGLKPILCVGENLKENEAGKTEEVITSELKSGLSAATWPDSTDGTPRSRYASSTAAA